MDSRQLIISIAVLHFSQYFQIIRAVGALQSSLTDRVESHVKSSIKLKIKVRNTWTFISFISSILGSSNTVNGWTRDGCSAEYGVILIIFISQNAGRHEGTWL